MWLGATHFHALRGHASQFFESIGSRVALGQVSAAVQPLMQSTQQLTQVRSLPQDKLGLLGHDVIALKHHLTQDIEKATYSM